MTSCKLIGQRLVEAGRIDWWQLRSALAHQRQWGGRLGQVVVDLGFVSERVMLHELALHLGVGSIDLDPVVVAPAVLALVPARLIRARRVLPVRLAAQHWRGQLIVAMEDPHDLTVVDEVAFAAGMRVEPVLASPRALEAAIRRHLDPVPSPPPLASGAGEDAERIELPAAPPDAMQVVTSGESLR